MTALSAPPDGGNGAGPLLGFEVRTEYDAGQRAHRSRVSIIVPVGSRTVRFLRAIPDREWRTLSSLAAQANEKGSCYLTVDEVARNLGVSVASAGQRLKDLAEFRFEGRAVISLTRHRLRDEAHRWYTVYQVNLVALAPDYYQGELFPATEASPDATPAGTAAGEEFDVTAREVAAARDPAPAREETARRGLDSAYARAEKLLGRPLSAKEIEAVQRWHADFGFPASVIAAVFEEGVERGKTKVAYLEAVARNWRDRGIRDLPGVERARAEYEASTRAYGRIISYLNLGRGLTQAEIDLLERWTGEWGFPEDVILLACSTTVNIHRPNFGYISRVLAGWRAAGVRTPDDARRALAERERDLFARQSSRTGGDRAKGLADAEGAGARGRGKRRLRVPKLLELTPEEEDERYYEQFVEKPGRRREGQ